MVKKRKKKVIEKVPIIVDGFKCENVALYAPITVTKSMNEIVDVFTSALTTVGGLSTYFTDKDIKDLCRYLVKTLSASPVDSLRKLLKVKGFPLLARDLLDDPTIFLNMSIFEKERDELHRQLKVSEKELEELKAERDGLSEKILDLEEVNLSTDDVAFESIRKDAIRLLQTSVKTGKVNDFAKMADVIDKMEGLFNNKNDDSKPTAININVVNYKEIDWETIDEHGSGEIQQYSKVRGQEYMKALWSVLSVMSDKERIEWLKERGVLAHTDEGVL